MREKKEFCQLLSSENFHCSFKEFKQFSVSMRVLLRAIDIVVFAASSFSRHKNNQNRLKNPWTALKDKHFNIWNENDFKKNTTDNVVFTKPAVVLNWNVICLQVTYCIIITKFIVSLFFSHIDLNFSTDRKMKNTFCLSL